MPERNDYFRLGNLTCTDGNWFESVCTYSCQKWYGLNDARLRMPKCTTDPSDRDKFGRWRFCNAAGCPAEVVPDNLKVVFTLPLVLPLAGKKPAVFGTPPPSTIPGASLAPNVSRRALKVGNVSAEGSLRVVTPAGASLALLMEAARAFRATANLTFDYVDNVNITSTMVPKCIREFPFSVFSLVV